MEAKPDFKVYNFSASSHSVNSLGFIGCCSKGINCKGNRASGEPSASAEYTIYQRVTYRWKTVALCNACFGVSKYSKKND